MTRKIIIAEHADHWFGDSFEEWKKTLAQEGVEHIAIEYIRVTDRVWEQMKTQGFVSFFQEKATPSDIIIINIHLGMPFLERRTVGHEGKDVYDELQDADTPYTVFLKGCRAYFKAWQDCCTDLSHIRSREEAPAGGNMDFIAKQIAQRGGL